MTPVVYDAGVLIAADRNVRTVWAEHKVRLEAGIVPAVPAPVVTQVSRSPAQVQLRRLLRGCEVVPLTQHRAHAAGQLLGTAGSADVVDAAVAQLAAELRADVVTGDQADIRPLLDVSGSPGRIIGLSQRYPKPPGLNSGPEPATCRSSRHKSDSELHARFGWSAVVAAIGALGLRCHDLRHSGNTLAAAGGRACGT
jgi:predicted nucleic acid-binding protein